MADLPQIVDCGHGEIFTTILSRLDILSLLPFPLFYSFVHFLIYGVFINKALHVFDDIKTIQTKKKHQAKMGNAPTLVQSQVPPCLLQYWLMCITLALVQRFGLSTKIEMSYFKGNQRCHPINFFLTFSFPISPTIRMIFQATKN
jgi:hypothetical protein